MKERACTNEGNLKFLNPTYHFTKALLVSNLCRNSARSGECHSQLMLSYSAAPTPHINSNTLSLPLDYFSFTKKNFFLSYQRGGYHIIHKGTSSKAIN